MYLLFKKVSITFILSILIGVTTGHAQQAGTISGTVINASNEQPLSGVNVGVVGTSKGAVTKDNGVFLITNISYGNKTLWVLKTSAVTYHFHPKVHLLLP
jgi:hypothetical protein